MNIDQHDHHDLQIDEALRALGPQLDLDSAPEALTERVDNVLSGRSTSDGPATLKKRVARLRWAVTGLTTVAAALAFCSMLLFAHVKKLEQAAAGRQIGRTLVAGWPVQTGTAPEYFILTLHHDICPRAAAVTPWFEHLPEEFDHSPAVFVVLDLSPTASSRAQEVADRLGLDLDRFKRNGYPETGKAWVLDAESLEVVRELESPSQCGSFKSNLSQIIQAASR